MKQNILQQYKAAVKTQVFCLFSLAEFFSLCGGFLQNVAQSWVVSETGGNLSLFLFVSYLPVFLFSYPFGILCDKGNKKKILIFTEIALAALSLLLFFLALGRQVRFWQMLMIGGAWGTLRALQNPCYHSMTKILVKGEALQGAVNIHYLVFNAARALGPFIAALLSPSLGMHYAFLGNAILFLPTLLLLLRLPVGEKTEQGSTAGIKKVLGQGRILGIFGLLFWVSLVGTNYNLLFVSLAKAQGSGAFGFSIVMALLGAGALVGAVLLPMLKKAPSPLLWCIVQGVLLVGISLWHSPVVLWGCIFGYGICDFCFLTTLSFKVQHATPKEALGRVMSLFVVLSNGAMSLGTLLLGWVMQYISVYVTILLVGGCLLATLPAYCFYQNTKLQLE